jgi:aryl-alcohol dehydrogenase-like predicted oxidoreductase
MIYKTLGSTDINASVIGLGTWAIGGWMWGGTDEPQAIAAIHAALDNGINLIDTAPMYGFGIAEEIVGKAIKGKRDKYIIATKCGLRWDLADSDTANTAEHFYSDDNEIKQDTSAKYCIYKYLKPESIRLEVERSLKRLQTDYIDVYQTHWQDSSTPLADSVGELYRLKKEGKIRAIGCSNITVEQLQEYQKFAPLDVDQEKLSLLDRGVFNNGVVENCKKSGVSFFAYSPLANGLLTGKLQPNQEFRDGDLRKVRPRFSAENIQNVNAKLEKLKPVAAEYGFTIGQLAIAWTLAKYEKVHALAGARTPEQVKQNAAAGNTPLKQSDVNEIEKMFCR